MEKIIGWALSYHFMQSSEASIKETKLSISSERYVYLYFNYAAFGLYHVIHAVCLDYILSIRYGLNIFLGIQNETKNLKKSLKVEPFFIPQVPK